MSVHFTTDDKIAETSSKGNQEKWFEDNRWYKLDQFGYEALAETLISRLLEHSNIEADTSFRFTRYQMERLHVHGRERTGCSSENFLLPGQSIITLSTLFKRETDTPLKEPLLRLPSDKKRMIYLAETTAEITGLADFPRYLTLLFEIDGRFLNDDRHLNNIAVLLKGETYDYCPIFDNGAGLLSNTQVLSMDIDPQALIAGQQARPFHTTFNRQVNTMQSLYGPQLRLPKLTRAEILAELEPLLSFYPQRDHGIIADRVTETILRRQ